MPVKLICASHSPLMEFASPQRAEQETNVRAAFEKMAAEVKAFGSTLNIIDKFLKI